jgi:hypothetical protein
MSAETMKMPDPIMEPTTSDTAASGPIPRMNSGAEETVSGALVDTVIYSAPSRVRTRAVRDEVGV